MSESLLPEVREVQERRRLLSHPIIFVSGGHDALLAFLRRLVLVDSSPKRCSIFVGDREEAERVKVWLREVYAEPFVTDFPSLWIQSRRTFSGDAIILFDPWKSLESAEHPGYVDGFLERVVDSWPWSRLVALVEEEDKSNVTGFGDWASIPQELIGDAALSKRVLQSRDVWLRGAVLALLYKSHPTFPAFVHSLGPTVLGRLVGVTDVELRSVLDELVRLKLVRASRNRFTCTMRGNLAIERWLSVEEAASAKLQEVERAVLEAVSRPQKKSVDTKMLEREWREKNALLPKMLAESFVLSVIAATKRIREMLQRDKPLEKPTEDIVKQLVQYLRLKEEAEWSTGKLLAYEARVDDLYWQTSSKSGMQEKRPHS